MIVIYSMSSQRTLVTYNSDLKCIGDLINME